MARTVKGDIATYQNKVRSLFFYVDGTGTASIVQGNSHATLTDNGTGDYTLTFVAPGRKLMGVAFSSITKVYHQLNSTSGASFVRVLTFNDAGTATDCDFYLSVFLSDSAYND